MRQSKNWLHLARVVCILEKHSERNIHTLRNIPNIPKETYRKRLSHSAVPDFPVYPTICLSARSTKAHHAYMHTHMHDSACINAYTHTRQRNIHACTHTCMHTYMHAHVHACTHTYTHNIHTHMHGHIHACTHTCIHIYLYTQHTCMHTHATYMHTHIHDSATRQTAYYV
jgi:hypothetical protein